MLIAAAERNIADAQLAGLSTENQFDAAYKAIMQTAIVALNANGYPDVKEQARTPPNGDPDTAVVRRSCAARGHRS